MIRSTYHLRISAACKVYDAAFSELSVDSVEVVEEETDPKEWTGKINIPTYASLIFKKT